MIKFSSYWEQCQFFLGTPNNPSLFLLRMAEKIKTVILYHQILSSKCTVHRQQLKGEIHRHMETTREIREKTQKKKWLFAVIAQVVIQSFRERSLWMRPSNQAWFDMTDTLFDERQWYENFRVTRDTFQFILSKIEGEITRQDTPCVEQFLVSADFVFYYIIYLLQQNTVLLQIFLVFRFHLCVAV